MIKTWRERLNLGDSYPLHAPTDVERAMVAEIAELRAAITSAQCIPVSDGDRLHLKGELA